jgi:GTP-binding protein HflX
LSGETATSNGYDDAGRRGLTAGRALVLVPVPRTPRRAGKEPGGRGREARIAEAVGLARAIDLDVVDAMTVPVAGFKPATLFGLGKVGEIAARVTGDAVGLVIVDHPLSPVQQRNLERSFKAKVIDRTGLILEIFGERARTREGTLQVELAHLSYQRSRLVRSWTHLERQRGGFGFLGGPGETQIEADRRMIGERIAKIERELATVATRRRLQRRNRHRSATPTVALVGYTNAGKSTLFNVLSKSEGIADDRLFATLDPTLRRVALPHGSTIILSDTVGFVSDLPTALIAAFRATLEEVTEADLILHVRDIAHSDSEAQAQDVAAVLGELGIDLETPGRIIEVWNKIDLLPEGSRPSRNGGSQSAQIVPISAVTGEGLDELLQAIESQVASVSRVFQVELSGEGLATLHRLYEYGEVLARTDAKDGSTIVQVRVPEERLRRFQRLFPEARKSD